MWPRNYTLPDIDEERLNDQQQQWKADTAYHRRSFGETTMFH